MVFGEPHQEGAPCGGTFAPRLRRSTPHTKDCRSGVCGFTHHLSGAWQVRNGDHVSGKRCSGLDLLGCDPGSGYATQELRTRKTELAYRSLRLRDDVRAASSSSPVVCRIVSAPPLCTPALVILGRTLLEGRASSRLSSRRRLSNGGSPSAITSPKVTSTGWFQRSQRVGRKCSTWRPSLIHASLGDSGGRFRWAPLKPPQAPSPAGGAGLPSSRCTGG